MMLQKKVMAALNREPPFFTLYNQNDYSLDQSILVIRT